MTLLEAVTKKWRPKGLVISEAAAVTILVSAISGYTLGRAGLDTFAIMMINVLWVFVSTTFYRRIWDPRDWGTRLSLRGFNRPNFAGTQL